MGDNTLRPVTIKQINSVSNPQEGIFKIDNADITQLSIVGAVRNMQTLETNNVYTVEDGTGLIEVRKWIDQNESGEDMDDIRHNIHYVRVYGRLNSFGGRVTVVAFSIRPITDFNEITYHFLDAVFAHLTYSKPSNSQSSGGINDIVNATIKSYSEEEEGASIDQIIFKLKDRYTEEDIRKSVDFLTLEGHCYFIDGQDYIKSTDC
ncbi:hypothetical protein BDB01DRAFT_713121 [Pilobolus umbonatus]|nr:hypothetical protein BDB01DRAFT_713121 [Pilobolus umbonatus]